jgi:hypothetical protein
MLDLINPFNYRNWAIFEEEDTKIPLWMVNLNFRILPQQSLQLLMIPQYIPANYPDEGPYWCANVTRWTDDYYQYYGIGVHYNEPTTQPSNFTWGARWSGTSNMVNYTLNYLYTWTQGLFDYPNTGDWNTSTYVNREPKRMQVLGGSADYCWQSFLGLESLVTRGEFAYFHNNLWVDYDFYSEPKDEIGFLLGLDKYFFVNWWVSVQYQLYKIFDPASQGYYSAGSGYQGPVDTAAVNNGVGTGMLRGTQNTVTFYMQKFWLPGYTLDTEFFFLTDQYGEGWIRPKVKFDFTSTLHGTLGANYFFGSRNYTWGEFHQNSDIFIEIKKDF